MLENLPPTGPPEKKAAQKEVAAALQKAQLTIEDVMAEDARGQDRLI